MGLKCLKLLLNRLSSNIKVNKKNEKAFFNESKNTSFKIRNFKKLSNLNFSLLNLYTSFKLDKEDQVKFNSNIYYLLEYKKYFDGIDILYYDNILIENDFDKLVYFHKVDSSVTGYNISIHKNSFFKTKARIFTMNSVESINFHNFQDTKSITHIISTLKNKNIEINDVVKFKDKTYTIKAIENLNEWDRIFNFFCIETIIKNKEDIKGFY